MDKAQTDTAAHPIDPMGEPDVGFDQRDNALTIFWTFLKLGCTSFGGPIAHLGYFREALVQRRGWVDDRTYADLVALCQFLPGPASSQTGLALGLIRGGPLGGLAAFVGFTLPSAIIMIALGLGIALIPNPSEAGWLQGFKLVAVAVVAQAVIGMAKNLCPDLPRASLGLAAGLAIFIAGITGSGLLTTQLLVILLGGLAGFSLLKPDNVLGATAPIKVGISKGASFAFGGLFFVLMAYLPVWALNSSGDLAAVMDSFYRAGALVFGGGHVVLPMLQVEVVTPGHMGATEFLAGYGAAQALPGPLFAFAGYLGAGMAAGPGGVLGGLLAVFAIFLPGFLLLLAALPYWSQLRGNRGMQGVLAGVNAAVVGILAAALINPIITSAVDSYISAVLAVAAVLTLTLYNKPIWWLVVALPTVGAVLL